MRVLHAVRSDGFAGVEAHVARLASAQHDHGHRVVVIGGDPGAMREMIARHDVITTPAATVADVTRAVRRFTATSDPVAVHTHMTAAELAAVAAVPLRHAIITTRHFAAVRGSTPATRIAGRVIGRRVSAQISVSHYIADHIDGPSRVIHPGVPVQPDAAPAADRERTVLVVQRLETEKETALALRAFARSRLAEDGWGLQLVGDGSQRPVLEGLSRSLGIQSAVTFLGHRTDVAERMRRAGILLAPCPVEGLGLTVIEAMAAGLPVVASAAGGHLETVGSVSTPRLHPVGDDRLAARLLSDLAADPAARDAYAVELQDQQRVHFSPRAQVEAIDAVYREVC